MTDTRSSVVEPTPLSDAVALAHAAPTALLALGIPSCPSCELLSVTLGAIARARPDLLVLLVTMQSQEDWDARETLLWPRGIHVSRASIPVMVVLRQGIILDTRHGGGPAAALDAWLTPHLGAATHPVAAGFTTDEHDALAGLATVRANILAAKASRSATG